MASAADAAGSCTGHLVSGIFVGMALSLRTIALALLTSIAAPVMATPPNPDAAQLQAGIVAFREARAASEGGSAASPAWRITRVLGCMPAFDPDRGGNWRNHWICVGATTIPDFHADAVVKVDGEDWRVVDLGGAAPACAPLDEAESAIRAIVGIEGLEITGEVDDGEGMLTDRRNGDTMVRHPYRIMCRYESNLATYQVYLGYADGRYVFDPGDMGGTGVPTPWFVRGEASTALK